MDKVILGLDKCFFSGFLIYFCEDEIKTIQK